MSGAAESGGAGAGGSTGAAEIALRTVGVEEEMLLVDAASGRALSIAGQVLADPGRRHGTTDGPEGRPSPGLDGSATRGILEKELKEEQIETSTQPHTDLASLGADLRRWRRTAIDAAQEAGAQVAALATSPLAVAPRTVDTPRYRAMTALYGLTGRQNLTCGCHVHVGVGTREEAVGVLDRIRSWLPPLIALSANSPFWQGEDTAYESYRTQAQARWPTAGPVGLFGSAASYDALVADLVATGTLLDAGMIYFDARASVRYPTVEVRVADVCLDADDAVLVAALCRALVTTAAAEWAEGEPPVPARAELLRLADWRASREGVHGALLDPVTGHPRPAAEVLTGLVEHVRPALRAHGDEAVAEQGVDAVLTRGTGADRQRAVLARTGELSAVVADAVRVTAGQA